MSVFATLVIETVFIVCHMFLKLYSLFCNDLYCPLNNLKWYYGKNRIFPI